MTEPEHILESLLEAMKARVQKRAADLALFQRAAEDFQTKAEDFRTKAEEFASAQRAEIVRTQKSMEVFEAELAAMREFQEASPPTEPSVPTEATIGDERERNRDAEPSESERIREAARRILGEAERPLMQRELKAKMDEIGVEIQSADPVELIRAALRRHRDEFRHVKGQGWALVVSDD